MDSKLKAKVILVACVLVTLIVATVLVANDLQYRSRKKTVSETVSTQEESDEPENVADQKFLLNADKDPRAFMQDEDFFDKEEEEIDPTTQLAMLVSSAAKDIRISVVDGNGDLVKNIPFVVHLTSAALEKPMTCKDLDKDGNIYVPELLAGKYNVSLEKVKGYEIAKGDVPVHVEEELSYTVLTDISYLIKTEDEIDPLIEDTAVNEAEMDADGTEDNRKLSKEDAILGIDVSKWNKEIDWKKVKADGIEFVIIRCGYRGSSTGALVEDPYFEKNVEGATNEGLKVGIYFFTQATNDVEGVEEASMVLSLCRGYKLAYPIYIDTEGAGGNGRADHIEKDSRTAAVKAFCETIENSGFNAGIYASKNWFEHNLDMKQLEGYQNWLAQYSNEPSYDGEYSMWQYTSAGSVDGITGRVDLDLSYMAY